MKKQEQKFWRYLAFGISALFSPYVATAIFIVLVVYNYSTDLNQFLPWMMTFFAFAIVLPGAYVLWLMESHKVDDIHLGDLRDRRIPFLVAAISSLAGTIVLAMLNAVHPVFVISMIYTINSIAIAIISQYWKISVHTGTFASIATVTVIIFGWSFWWLYLFLIPLAWSRIHRKRHTIWQTLAGAAVTSILTLVTFEILRYF